MAWDRPISKVCVAGKSLMIVLVGVWELYASCIVEMITLAKGVNFREELSWNGHEALRHLLFEGGSELEP